MSAGRFCLFISSMYFFLPCWKKYINILYTQVLYRFSICKYFSILSPFDKVLCRSKYYFYKVTQPLKIWGYRYIQPHQHYCLPFWWLYICILYGPCVDLLAEVGIHLSTSHFFFPLAPHLSVNALYYSSFYHFQINIGLFLEPLFW